MKSKLSALLMVTAEKPLRTAISASARAFFDSR
jgi:hypothetical protein